MSISDLIAYLDRNANCINPTIVAQMAHEIQKGDNPDLSHITATADKILTGFKSVNTTGAEITGTCAYNVQLPAEALTIPDADWGITSGKKYIVKEGGAWVVKTVA